MSATLDEAIARLQDLRTKVPGDTPIRCCSQYNRNALREPSFGIARKGKNDERLVSARGVPFIMITDY